MDIETTAETAGKLSEFGIVAILLFLFLMFGFGVATLSWWIAKRVFGTSGIAERMTNAHIQFLDKLDSSVTESVEIQRRHEKLAGKTDSTIRSLLTSHVIAADHLKRIRMVWKRNVTVMRGIARQLQLIDLDEQLNEMEHLLDVPSDESEIS